MTKTAIKSKVRERDGNKCVDCGAVRNIGKMAVLDVHRLVPESEYSLEGCVTLCRLCHRERHRGGILRRPRRIDKAGILELLAITGWKRRRLANRMKMSENIVQRWIMGDRVPSGPASILMRMWLEEARAREAANGKLAGAAS